MTILLTVILNTVLSSSRPLGIKTPGIYLFISRELESYHAMRAVPAINHFTLSLIKQTKEETDLDHAQNLHWLLQFQMLNATTIGNVFLLLQLSNL